MLSPQRLSVQCLANFVEFDESPSSSGSYRLSVVVFFNGKLYLLISKCLQLFSKHNMFILY